MSGIIATIITIALVANLAIPLLIAIAESVINFSFRKNYNLSEYVIRYQRMKYSRLLSITSLSDAMCILWIMDVMVGFMVWFLCMLIIINAPWAFIILVLPFIIRFLTRGRE